MTVRLFVTTSQLSPGTLVLSGEEHHYLSRVRRLRAGDVVTLVDGQGHLAQASLLSVAESSSHLSVGERQAVQAPHFTLNIAPALIKGERMDIAITKMVELGVAGIYPVTTEHCVVKLKPERAASRHKRFASLALAAARQSQNAHPAHIAPISSLSDLLKHSPPAELKLIPCLSSDAQPLADRLPSAKLGSAMILIGPEGGFSQSEIDNACEAGFQPISLGLRVLRAETAAIAMASILSFRYGDVGTR